MTDWLLFILILQVTLLPLQAPDQPVKVDPGTGDAVNVTEVPAS